jgi:hypothetical protein
MKSIGKQSCLLCGAEADVWATDLENRRLYRCSNLACGEYEISRRAIERVNSPQLKKHLSSAAARNKDDAKILEIIIESDGNMVSRVVDKGPHLR